MGCAAGWERRLARLFQLCRFSAPLPVSILCALQNPGPRADRLPPPWFVQAAGGGGRKSHRCDKYACPDLLSAELMDCWFSDGWLAPARGGAESGETNDVWNAKK